MSARVLVCDDENVLLANVAGQIKLAEFYRWVFDACLSSPGRINFPIIFDVRGWVGMVSEAEILQQTALTDEFRAKHQLAPGYRPLIVLFADETDHVKYLAAHVAHARHGVVLNAFSADNAWSLAAPQSQMPPSARKFLR
jgi:hypothetical protein